MSQVDIAFEKFINNILSLDSQTVDLANRSTDYLFDQLRLLSEKGTIPSVLLKRSFVFGSLAKRTKIPPINDIDLMVCFSAEGNVVVTEYAWDNIKLTVESEKSSLSKYCDIKYQNYYLGTYESVLNSNKFKNKIVSALGSVYNYKKSDLHARGEAVTLELSSYSWTFDIVPAFYYEENGETIYVIPNGKGAWKKTNPTKEIERIKALDVLFDNKASVLVKMVKYWNNKKRMPTVTSYVLETMVMDYLDTLEIPKTGAKIFVDLLFRDFLDYANKNIYSHIYDSKDIEGDINDLSFEERFKISLKSKTDYDKAKKATFAELTEKNIQKSINIWSDIFGEDFIQDE